LKIVQWAHKNIDENIYLSRSFLKDHGKDIGLDEKCAGVAFISLKSLKIIC
jgi:hypothetical protein